MNSRLQVTWECQETLFRTDAADADDLRLSVKLFRTCLADKRKFCPDVAPGAGRAKACLEEHRDDSGFGKDCKYVYVPITASSRGLESPLFLV